MSFAPAQRGGGLTEAKISESDFVENFQPRKHFVRAGEKCKRLTHGELQHFVNVAVPIAHVEHAGFESRSFAFVADQFDIREELHFHRNRSVALACFATAAGNVE